MTTLTDPDPTTDPETAEEPVVDAPQTTRKRPSLGIAILVMLLVGGLLAGLIALVVARDDGATPDSRVIEVPADTAAKLRDGGDDLVPSLIRLQPGQQLVLKNGDWRPHTLGTLTAERGKTVRQTFATEGRHITATSLRSDGRVTILVEKTSN